MRTKLRDKGARPAAARDSRSVQGAGRLVDLRVGVGYPVSTLPPLPDRVEQKFFVAPRDRELALALLRRTCRADKVHPVGQVNSLYFDTSDLDQHDRSVSGEHAKDKVRIRWYGEEYDPHRRNGRVGRGQGDGRGQVGLRLADPTVDIWLELKSRRGFASTKQRLPLAVPAALVAYPLLSKGIVSAHTMLRTMAAFGFMARGRLLPVVAISYWRYRFVEPETGFRISIDSRIRSTLVMAGLGRGERALELPGAVVEVKGPVFDLPRSLRQIAEIGGSWTRYSKYSSSLEAHEAANGSVSRLWPSGTMEPDVDRLARLSGSRAAWVAHSDGMTDKVWGAKGFAPRFMEDYEA